MTFLTSGLNDDQIKALQISGEWLANHDFYLAGGTALAIYFGHRKSVDLDWFINERIPDPLILAQNMKADNIPIQIEYVARGTLYGTIYGVKASMIEYLYPLLGPVLKWEKNGSQLASLNDLCCMKLSAIAQRGSKKDFFDLYVLGEKYCSLADMISLYRKKYGVSDVSHLIYSLVYFDDAERDPDPVLLMDIDWARVKKEIPVWVRKLGKSFAK